MGRITEFVIEHKRREPEWSGAYLDYEEFKKDLHRFCVRTRESIDRGARRASAPSSPASRSDEEAIMMDSFNDPEPFKLEESVAEYRNQIEEKYAKAISHAVEFYDKKVDEFLGLCDERESRWQKTQSTTKRELRGLYASSKQLAQFLEVNEIAAERMVSRYAKHVALPTSTPDLAISIQPLTTVARDGDMRSIQSKIETAFKKHYSKREQKEALERFVSNQQNKLPRRDVFQLGLMVGFLPCALLYTIHLIDHEETQKHLHSVLPIFRFAGSVILMFWLWAFNLWVFETQNINHIFIFDLCPVGCLTSLKVAVISACLTALLFVGAFFWSILPHHVWIPGVAPILMLAVWVMPIKVLYHSTRKALAITTFHLVILPFGPVRFREYWLADQFTSMHGILNDFCFFIAFYCHGGFADSESEALHWAKNITGTWKYALDAAPYWWRWAQCIKMISRCRNTGKPTWPHITNAGKYTSLLIATLLEAFVGIWGWNPWWFIVSKSIAQTYSCVWDILMDWGFYVGWAKRPRLFSVTPFYILAWFQNAFLRSTFLFPYILPAPWQGAWLSTLSGWGEIWRRFVWNIFRVENEMRMNLESYRAGVFVPPPVSTPKLKESFIMSLER